MTYLLDTMFLSYVLHTGREAELSALSESVSLATCGEVRDELEAHHTLGPRWKKWLPHSGLRVLEIAVGSREHAVLLALADSPLAKKGRGERACIAVAANDHDLVFVSHDKNAMWLALRELHLPGERMIGVPVFLRRLMERGLSPEAADDVLLRCNVPAPTWWQAFRAGLPAAP